MDREHFLSLLFTHPVLILQEEKGIHALSLLTNPFKALQSSSRVNRPKARPSVPAVHLSGDQGPVPLTLSIADSAKSSAR